MPRSTGIEDEIVLESSDLEKVIKRAIMLGFFPRRILQTLNATLYGHIELFSKNPENNFAAITSEYLVMPPCFYLFVPNKSKKRLGRWDLYPARGELIYDPPRLYNPDGLSLPRHNKKYYKCVFTSRNLLEVVRHGIRNGYIPISILQIDSCKTNGHILLSDDSGSIHSITSERTYPLVYNLYLKKVVHVQPAQILSQTEIFG